MANSDKRINKRTEISSNQIETLMKQLDPTFEVQDISLILEGLSTTNYMVTVNHAQRFLVKVYQNHRTNNHLEHRVMKAVSHHVNVPKIHCFDQSKKIIDYDYLIMDYIEGKTLSVFTKEHKKFNSEMMFKIGTDLGKIHHINYQHMGLIDDHFDIIKKIIPVSQLFDYYLKSHVGANLNTKSVQTLKDIINHHGHLLKSLDENCVFAHGDFNPNNVIVDQEKDIWYIDFEYCMSAPYQLDIGKFFRKRNNFSEYMTLESFNQFIEGYHQNSHIKYEDNWMEKAMLTDLTSLLGLINKKDPNEDWVKYVEKSIDATFTILSR